MTFGSCGMVAEVRTDIKTSSWGCLFGHVGKPACLASAGDPWRGFGVPAPGLLAHSSISMEELRKQMIFGTPEGRVVLTPIEDDLPEVKVNRSQTKGDTVGVVLGGLVFAFIIWSMFFTGQSSSNQDESWQPMTNTVRTTQTDSFGNVNTSEVEVNGMVNNRGIFIADPRTN